MISKGYLDWLWRSYGQPYWSRELFQELASKDYIWQMQLDENRAHNGLLLRDQYSFEANVYKQDVAKGPCTVLEMICAMGEDTWQQCGQKSPKLFVKEMLENLGLNKSNCNVNYILDNWLNRAYSDDGSGSIFHVPNTKIKNLDTWQQMLVYINYYYPLDKNYLKN